MFRKICFFAWLSVFALTAQGQTTNNKKAVEDASTAQQTCDRETDGLLGPVRRVIVESSKITVKNGEPSEGARALRAATTYDQLGKRVDAVAYPIDGTTPQGKEQYKYDDKGNIIEMQVRGSDGTILSRETYKYVFDELGNWKQMTTNIAVLEDGKLGEEPVEVTYRAITYYYTPEVTKLAAASSTRSASNEVAKITPVPDKSTQLPPPVTAERVSEEVVPTPSGPPATEPPKETVAKVNIPSNANDPTNHIASSPATSAPAIKSSPTAATLFKQGVADLESGNLAGAADTLRKSVDRDPEYVPAYVKLGLAYAGLRKYKEAVAVFKMAIQIKPAQVDAEAYFQLGNSYSGLGKHDDALKAFKQALNLSRAETLNPEDQGSRKIPSALELHYSIGLAYNRLGRFPEAIKELKQVISINPKLAEAYYGLAACYIGVGDRKSAEKQQQILTTLNPDLAEKIAEALSTNRNMPPGVSEGMLGGRTRRN